MSDDGSYTYTRRDLLAEPETYEYSEVLGRPFLDAYVDDRRRTLAVLRERLSEDGEGRSGTEWEGLLSALRWADTTQVEGHLPPLAGRSSGDASSLRPIEEVTRRGEPVETGQVLAALVGYARARPPDSDRAKKWLDRLTKRFEVRKRLYAAYTPEMRPLGDETVPTYCYTLLALAALVSHGRTGNLKHLNVALKLCDVASSKRDAITDEQTASLAWLAIDEERGAVSALASEAGVTL